ncbi:hypothetical protein [Campylobacter sp. RM16187]|uniref:hypothetical protein n=1 Tax=Campylobacter sp. RM16187 TaxID=1660063 RepID=UPI0021B61047|nr:hypothetical protein [Campylobacter sp. RM16187]QKG30005.1 putative membrane protein [Campylobacter sp. RM16187]
MRKWQELSINAFMNISVAMIAGGILKKALEYKSVVSSVIMIVLGLYLLGIFILIAQEIETKD